MIYFAFALILLVAAFGVGHHFGRQDGYKEGSLAAHRARQAQLKAHIDGAKGKVFPLTIEAFAEHCHLTVTSDLYGTPDWWTHICFKKSGETGEFMEHVGKASRDDGWSIFNGVKTLKPERRLALIKEIGDGWWYDIMILHELGSTAQEAMLVNIEKRESRKARGTIKGAGDNR